MCLGKLTLYHPKLCAKLSKNGHTLSEHTVLTKFVFSFSDFNYFCCSFQKLGLCNTSPNKSTHRFHHSSNMPLHSHAPTWAVIKLTSILPTDTKIQNCSVCCSIHAGIIKFQKCPNVPGQKCPFLSPRLNLSCALCSTTFQQEHYLCLVILVLDILRTKSKKKECCENKRILSLFDNILNFWPFEPTL